MTLVCGTWALVGLDVSVVGVAEQSLFYSEMANDHPVYYITPAEEAFR